MKNCGHLRANDDLGGMVTKIKILKFQNLISKNNTYKTKNIKNSKKNADFMTDVCGSTTGSIRCCVPTRVPFVFPMLNQTISKIKTTHNHFTTISPNIQTFSSLQINKKSNTDFEIFTFVF